MQCVLESHLRTVRCAHLSWCEGQNNGPQNVHAQTPDRVNTFCVMAERALHMGLT